MPATTTTQAAMHIDSLDAATGEVIARFELTPPDAVAAVVERARETQRQWAATPLRARCEKLRRLRDVIHARRQEIAEVISREVGKPRVEATLAEVMLAADAAAYYAGHAPRLLRPERVPHHSLGAKAKSGWMQYEPMGVLGIISPWNFPVGITLGQIIPALAAGNAVVLKPSEVVPWCGALVAELVEQAGFPAGLVTVIQGAGDVGAALVEAKPDKVIFTGSVATGRRVAEACARHLIPSVLELGGKDAMVVLADADLDVTASAAVWGAFTNCGQMCLSVERLYVDQSIAEKFIAACVEKTRKLRAGPPSEPDTDMGPMIRPRQVAIVEEHLRDAVAQGARVLTGGTRLPELGETFFAPTVVVDVHHGMKLMREETFGPVLAIQVVGDTEEAIRLANDSLFALSASVWTRDSRRGREIASRLEAGAVMVNDVASYFGICEAPHGGRRSSGWGRTHSRVGMMELVQVKYIDVDRLPRWPKSWWFGYSQELAVAADAGMEAMFAPDWRKRLSSVPGALRMIFRRGRV
ncbi:MAG TPA: aldehyde dehydrogenase family protein [Candidatus Acidoferrales bacterium]